MMDLKVCGIDLTERSMSGRSKSCMWNNFYLYTCRYSARMDYYGGLNWAEFRVDAEWTLTLRLWCSGLTVFLKEEQTQTQLYFTFSNYQGTDSPAGMLKQSERFQDRSPVGSECNCLTEAIKLCERKYTVSICAKVKTTAAEKLTTDCTNKKRLIFTKQSPKICTKRESTSPMCPLWEFRGKGTRVSE